MLDFFSVSKYTKKVAKTKQHKQRQKQQQQTIQNEPWKLNSRIYKPFRWEPSGDHQKKKQTVISIYWDNKNRYVGCLIRPVKPLNLRVWSWLRMNAGGVLNTCKSSGAQMRIPFGGETSELSGGRVRNAWVICPCHRDNTSKGVLIPDEIQTWHRDCIKVMRTRMSLRLISLLVG